VLEGSLQEGLSDTWRNVVALGARHPTLGDRGREGNDEDKDEEEKGGKEEMRHWCCLLVGTGLSVGVRWVLLNQ